MSDIADIVLVVPTIRENCFRDFVDRWGPLGLFGEIKLVVMEDNPKKTFDAERLIEKHSHFKAAHFCWEDIERELGAKSWVIPRRSDTVRSFAYWWVWKKKQANYIFTLDDDCYPPIAAEDSHYFTSARDLVGGHLSAITGRTRWFNTLNEVKPRGIPFYNLGKRDDIVLNHGLWTNVLDYDAPYQLANPVPEKFSFDNRIVPQGSYFPMCGMNVMWKAEATVLMYHLLMGQWCDPKGARLVNSIDDIGYVPPRKLPFDRFGDIWCGIFMKRICDLKGLSVSSGTPYIRHERASNPFANLKKEANGIEVNEKLWEHVDAFRPICPEAKPLYVLYRELGLHMKEFKEYPEHAEYFGKLGDAMVAWAELFELGAAK